MKALTTTVEDLLNAFINGCMNNYGDFDDHAPEAMNKATQAITLLIQQAELRGARNTDAHWIFEMNSQSDKTTEEWKEQITRHKEWFDKELAQLKGGSDEK